MNFKHFTMQINAQRCSGEMNTSLSNGLANLLVFLFLVDQKFGLKPSDVIARVEGDDGAFATKNNLFPDESDYTRLGFKVKMQFHKNIGTSSFCGLIFDLEDQKVMADPWKHMSKFGWCKPKYSGCRKSKLLALLRAKGFSYAYQYDGCPILMELGIYALRVTKHIDIRWLMKSRDLDIFERDRLIFAIQNLPQPSPVGMNSRLLFEELYGISVSEQLEFEAYLRTLNSPTPIDFPFTNIPRVLQDCYFQFVQDLPQHNPSLLYFQVEGTPLNWTYKLLDKRSTFNRTSRI